MRALALIAGALFTLFTVSFLVAEGFGITEAEYFETLFAALTQRYGAWAVPATVGALLAGDLFLPVPSSVLMTFAGKVSGFAVGFVVNAAGALVSAFVGFGLCRVFGQRAFARLVGDGESARVEAFFARYGVWAILLSRPVPMLTEVTSCLAGLSEMRFARFAALSTAGTLPLCALYAWAGAAARGPDAEGWPLLAAVAVPALGFAVLRFAMRGASMPDADPEAQ